MTSKTAAALLLSDMDVTKSQPRPWASNDNSYSETWFTTLKFAPVFPERIGSLGDATWFMTTFVEGHDYTHRHTGIELHAPADVHSGLAADKAIEHSAVLAAARAADPERFSSTTEPKILALSGTTRINKPAPNTALPPKGTQEQN